MHWDLVHNIGFLSVVLEDKFNWAGGRGGGTNNDTSDYYKFAPI